MITPDPEQVRTAGTPDQAVVAAVEERVARYMAAEDWLEDAQDDVWWANRSPKFRNGYLTAAHDVLDIVQTGLRTP